MKKQRPSVLYLLPLLIFATPVFAQTMQEQSYYVGGGLGVVGLILFFMGFSTLKRRRLIEDTPRSTIRAMAPGQVEIAGTTVAWRPLAGPFSQKPCVYYEYLVEEQRERTVGTGKDRHTETYWATIKSEDTSLTPFYLDDSTAKALIKPEKAEMVLVGSYELQPGFFQDIPPHVVEFLKARDVDCYGLFGFRRPLRFTERILALEQSLVILGTCQTSENLADAPEGAAKDVCLAKGTRGGDLFLISAKSAKSLESGLAWKAFFLLFFAAGFIGGALYVLVILSGRY